MTPPPFGHPLKRGKPAGRWPTGPQAYRTPSLSDPSSAPLRASPFKKGGRGFPKTQTSAPLRASPFPPSEGAGGVKGARGFPKTQTPAPPCAFPLLRGPGGFQRPHQAQIRSNRHKKIQNKPFQPVMDYGYAKTRKGVLPPPIFSRNLLIFNIL